METKEEGERMTFDTLRTVALDPLAIRLRALAATRAKNHITALCEHYLVELERADHHTRTSIESHLALLERE